MCGVIGILGSSSAVTEIYRGLFTLQHRGQDAAGILSYDFQVKKFKQLKDLGLVSEIFDKNSISSLESEMAIGHTRYSTVGKGEKSELQPQLLNYPIGIGMAHNGNLINYYELSDTLKKTYKRELLTGNDIELILNLFATELEKRESYEDFEQIADAFQEVNRLIIGGYAIVGQLAQIGMFAVRDPNGIRPLIMGRRKLSDEERAKGVLNLSESIIFCSESNTLNALDYEIVRDVEPGEIIFVDRKGKVFSKKITHSSRRHCMFEWVYFSSAESIINNKSVYESRLNLGKVLSLQVKACIERGEISPDVLAPIPETSRLSAIALAEELRIPYRELLIKNRYVHRSFILENDEKRKQAISMKLAPVKHEVQGKNILLIDDSIVRGNTSKQVIESLRKCGAKEIYLASTCPEIRYPCYFGIDFPNRDELVAVGRSHKEIERTLGVEKVIYASREDLIQALGSDEMCMACLDGHYPVNTKNAKDFAEKRKSYRS